MFVKLYTGYGLRVTHRGRDGKEKVRTKLLMPGQVVDLPHDEAMELIGRNLAVLETAGPVADVPEAEEGNDTPTGEKPAEGQETADTEPDDLQGMTVAQLKVMAADLGLNASDCKRKQDLIDLIREADADAVEDGEAPPDLGAEAPVV